MSGDKIRLKQDEIGIIPETAGTSWSRDPSAQPAVWFPFEKFDQSIYNSMPALQRMPKLSKTKTPFLQYDYWTYRKICHLENEPYLPVYNIYMYVTIHSSDEKRKGKMSREECWKWYKLYVVYVCGSYKCAEVKVVRSLYSQPFTLLH